MLPAAKPRSWLGGNRRGAFTAREESALAANVYEGMFILDSNSFGRDSEAVSGRVVEVIQKAGGEILVSRLWEDRRLAYPIKGHRKGTYWLTYFRLDSSQLSAIRRQYQLSEDVIRMLFLKVDPRIVDALVAHAQSVVLAPPGEAAGPKTPPPVEDIPAVVVDAIEDVPDTAETEADE
jgi:small subunit ribosomal protein S6